MAFRLAQVAIEKPHSLIPYITRTREDAKDILHPPLIELNQRYDLGLRFRQNNGDVCFPNGSRIFLRGANNMREVEKLRGKKFPIVGIDEAQNFPEDLMAYMLEQVIEPATMDYIDSQILMGGTPNASCAGPFHEMITGKTPGWSVHGWVFTDNPHLPDPVGQLADLRRRRGWTVAHPAYRREYLGQWVRDAEGLVYEFNPRINAVPQWNKEIAADWQYLLGIDLGFNDPTAFVVIAYSVYLGKVYVVESYKEEGLISSAVAARVEGLMRRYPIESIVADSGGFGKGYVEELKLKFGLIAKAAEKTDKYAYIQMLNSDLRTGTLIISTETNGTLLQELQQLQWDEKFRERGGMKEDPAYDNHLCDALLYAWRECHHHSGDWEKNAPKEGTTEAFAAEEEKMWDEVIESAKVRDSAQWWDTNPQPEDPEGF